MRNSGMVAGVMLGLLAAGLTSWLWTPIMVIVALVVATTTTRVVDSTTRKQISS